MKEHITKFSGIKQEYSTGATRDTSAGKGRFDLIPTGPLTRVAKVYERGAKNHGERNWEKGFNISRAMDSAIRHIVQYLGGKRDEDHLAQSCWNLLAAMHFEMQIEKGNLPKELNDLPTYYGDEGEIKAEEKELKVVSKFKIGDLVNVINNPINVNLTKYNPWKIEKTNGIYYDCHSDIGSCIKSFLESSLEHFDPLLIDFKTKDNTKPTPKFKIGELVNVIDTSGYSSYAQQNPWEIEKIIFHGDRIGYDCYSSGCENTFSEPVLELFDSYLKKSNTNFQIGQFVNVKNSSCNPWEIMDIVSTLDISYLCYSKTGGYDAFEEKDFEGLYIEDKE